MVNDDRKQERSFILHYLENKWTAIMYRKSLKSIPGFEPSLLSQNTIALPLAPPPQPFSCNEFIILATAG